MKASVHEHIINKRTVDHDFLYKRLDIPIVLARALAEALTSKVGERITDAIQDIYNHFADRPIDIEPILEAYVSDTPIQDLIRQLDAAGIEECTPLMMDMLDDEWDDKVKFFGNLHSKEKRLKPFLGVHPDYRTLDQIREAFKDYDFFGIKMYPPMGVNPNDVKLRSILSWSEYNNIPITVHCSMGGLKYPNVPSRYTDPDSWADILINYPNLRICLAHMGGSFTRWTKKILSWGQEFENLFVDISFHDEAIFEPDEWRNDFLDAYDKIPDKIMFGADWPLSSIYFDMKEFAARVKSLIGDEAFSIITEVNTERFMNG